MPLRSTMRLRRRRTSTRRSQELRRGVEILVATPGRLLDHVQQKTVDLRQVEILVLDEADRMLDMGFIPDIKRIIALLPAKRQNLLFSATFPDEIRKLAAHVPAATRRRSRSRARNAPAELVTQVRAPGRRATRKRELLAHLVKTNNWQQVLVFCQDQARRQPPRRSSCEQGRHQGRRDPRQQEPDRSARARSKRFKDGKLQVLVATDIAARGLDIEELPHVVNFDLPHVAEDYVHRIGRTGRAGATGEAMSLVCAEDRPLLAAIERLINKKIEVRHADGFEPAVVRRASRASRAGAPRSEAARDRGRPQRGTRRQPRRAAASRSREEHAQAHA